MLLANNLSNYQTFLEGFIDRGYQFISFTDEIKPTGQLILRHDVDFDTGYALEAARIESGLNISSTFFFLIRAPFYSILNPIVFDHIQEIRELGHKISIHFDPTIYSDFEKGLELERHYFKTVFNEYVDFISLHRPNKFFLEYDQGIDGVEHTYMSKYFHDIKYISDSTGMWRYGHPYDSEEFQSLKTIHLLTHPIWWFIDEGTNLEKLKEYWEIRKARLKQDLVNNSNPFKEIVAGLDLPANV